MLLPLLLLLTLLLLLVYGRRRVSSLRCPFSCSALIFSECKEALLCFLLCAFKVLFRPAVELNPLGVVLAAWPVLLGPFVEA